jgi:hypothetical protein
MFKSYLLKLLSVEYEDKILIFDLDNIKDRYNYTILLIELGFRVVTYNEKTEFRYLYESEIKNSNNKIAVIIEHEQYVPYDILKSFYVVKISWLKLFPNLNNSALSNNKDLDLDLLYSSYTDLYDNMAVFEKTNEYISEKVYSKENIFKYTKKIKEELNEKIKYNDLNYNSWIDIAEKKGKAEHLAAKSEIEMDFSYLESVFEKYMFDGYQAISSIIQKDSPLMLSRVMDFITKKKEKVALIVLDGMSVFDFNIISSHFKEVDYDKDFIFAMVPTTTSISRQSLLAGKFPVELERPFNLTFEEKEFVQKAKSVGYIDNQIMYSRGYDSTIGPNVKCLSIILNDIDDLVHGQTQGRIGMYNDVNLYAKSGRLEQLIKELLSKKFNVYLTSDHGNTLCKGLGMMKSKGVEVETKSKRMIIYKDFADVNEAVEKFDLIEYPGYYLDKKYKYYFCKNGKSLDAKDSIVMTHGGFSIEEVIVPFITIKER